jgi:hypothetical protein
MNIPEDIIKNVTRENALELFDEYMVVLKTTIKDSKNNNYLFSGSVSTKLEYVWEPSVMRDFIKALLK